MREPRSTAAPTDLAAQLALLALRSSIRKNIALDPGQVAVNGAPAMPVDAAVRKLADIPKPVICHGQAEGGLLAVQSLPLSDADDQEREWFHLRRQDDADRGGFMGWLADRYGSADHIVLATGRGDSLALPVWLWSSGTPITRSKGSTSLVTTSKTRTTRTCRSTRRRRGLAHMPSYALVLPQIARAACRCSHSRSATLQRGQSVARWRSTSSTWREPFA